MEIISRAAAASIGSKHFFTGRICKNGHAAPRYVSTGNCTECQAMFSAKNLGSARVDGLIPAQHVHADDREQVFAFIDYLNAARGLPPALRPGRLPTMPTPWEVYLTKEMKRPFTARPSLEDMKRAARIQGIEVSYTTMAEPVDNWTRAVAMPLAALSTMDPAVRKANEEHNSRLTAQAEASTAHPDVAARKAAMAAELERDGYLPDELTKRP